MRRNRWQETPLMLYRVDGCNIFRLLEDERVSKEDQDGKGKGWAGVW